MEVIRNGATFGEGGSFILPVTEERFQSVLGEQHKDFLPVLRRPLHETAEDVRLAGA